MTRLFRRSEFEIDHCAYRKLHSRRFGLAVGPLEFAYWSSEKSGEIQVEFAAVVSMHSCASALVVGSDDSELARMDRSDQAARRSSR
jgi:hypothetical protein